MDLGHVFILIAPTGLARRDVVTNGRAMIGPDGRKIGAVVSYHDVTGREVIGQMLRESLGMLAAMLSQALALPAS